jgi:hypothetical protein
MPRKRQLQIILPKEPTELVQMTYADWYQEAIAKERPLALTKDSMQHFNSTFGPYYYFRLIGCGETGTLGDCDRINISEYQNSVQ